MSNEIKGKDEADAAAEPKDEITEEQLESVSGGILIGLNQPGAHKDIVGHKDLKVLGGLKDQAVSAGIKFVKL